MEIGSLIPMDETVDVIKILYNKPISKPKAMYKTGELEIDH